ncbi:ArsA family ATPase [Virgibacillus sp. 179-BFC.A HS]|uniref:ArsA family ATPase n=1 Tax=Tigheibacillus jepli TaxID=3035914 RepID=A0ABU5CI92_9BACI|nr:ArsA family ATPase [Virgibacillus sp. 179-BFC.A HS]MDY0406053.1 ArsA family ATPase [Virgibacillus sp. 179-BFC.A HS]
MDELEKKLLFIGGKGGVGKSTTAAAIACKAADSGRKTLLVSTDPAHNIGDIFHKKITGKITKINDHLDALEIDPEKETDAYIAKVRKNMVRVVHSGMIAEVNRQLETAKASPGADEAALFDKLIAIILDEAQRYDTIIFDTAPTGHTIRMLSLPELMGVWMDGLLEKREQTNKNYSQLLNDGERVDDPIYETLKVRQYRFRKAREIMLDAKQTGFVFVLNPERLPILETEKAIKILDKYHLHVKSLVVNKILPDHADGVFLQERRLAEKHYLQQIEETFHKQKLYYVPLFTADISNKTALKKYSSYF